MTANQLQGSLQVKYCLMEITPNGEAYTTMVTQAQFEIHSGEFSTKKQERELGRRHVLSYHGNNIIIAIVECSE